MTAASSALRPFQDDSWCDGRPLKTYFTSLMFRQQTPKPGRARDVPPPVLWLRTRMSVPLKTPAFCMIVLAGGPTSSAGVPKIFTRPGTRRSVMYCISARAAAMATGVCALCWSP